MLKEDILKRLNRIADEIQRVLEELIGELPENLRKDEPKNDAEQLELLIYNYLKGIKVAYLTSQSRRER